MELSAEHIIQLTTELNQSILDKNFEKYKELTSEELTCFEPEGEGHLIHGLKFHEFYYRKDMPKLDSNLTIMSPFVKFLGNNTVAIIAYVKTLQILDTKSQQFKTIFCEETRVWNLDETKKKWIHVHVHRSPYHKSG